MKIGWVGFHVEGIPALEAVLEAGWTIDAFITLRPDRAAKRSGATDYSPICEKYGVPSYEIANINDAEAIQLLKTLDLDVVFVIGWSQIVRAEALQLTKLGMIGAHASLLPRNRGRAPINWVLIHGESETGNTLMWLDESVDSGMIIDQMVIPITDYDSCATLYEKVAETNREMILRLLPRLAAGERPGSAQTHLDEPLLPGRRPEDGQADWSLSNRSFYNFVRALARPYPGAFSTLEGKRWKIWQSALLPGEAPANSVPGEVIGAVYSPIAEACGQVVACGKGTILLLEIEGEDGEIIKGSQLSDQPWQGKVWSRE